MLTLKQFSDSILPFVLKWESGYVNDSDDKGGVTYRGITRKNNPTWPGWKVIDKLKSIKRFQIIPELEPEVVNFYWQLFRSNGFDRLNSPKVALAMFDYKVHGGFSLSVLRSIILSKFGKNLVSGSELSWVNTQNEDSIASAIIEHRENYLKKIIAKDPTQKKFEDGWFKRLTALKTYINLKTVGISAGVIFILIAIYFFFFYKKGQTNETNQSNQN